MQKKRWDHRKEKCFCLVCLTEMLLQASTIQQKGNFFSLPLLSGLRTRASAIQACSAVLQVKEALMG